MNYLVLTPDGVGSTLLQRALTVYLNSAGLNYYNTHELLNGLTLANNNALVKDFSIGYTQSLVEIQDLLIKNSANLVSRLADYHVYNRLKHKKENYVDFYKFCNQYYNKIVFCTRDPFEYALSWAIRNRSNTLNVYSVAERIKIHSSDQKYNINIDYFKSKLDQYIKYQYWVHDNFTNVTVVNYDDLNFDIDQILENLTGVDTTIEKTFGVSLKEYSKILYQVSLQKQNPMTPGSNSPTKTKTKGILALYNYQRKLIEEKKLTTTVPHKMNTLLDKQQKILNFNIAVDQYNNWAVCSNYFKEIDIGNITDKITKEQGYYDIK